MKLKVVIVLLVIAAAWMVGRQAKGGHEASAKAGQEEINRTFQLAPGAQVEIKGINGPVEIQTADGDIAEVHITRSADDRDALEREKIVVEQSATSLSVYGKKGDGHWWNFFGNKGQVRQQVTLKLPRRIELTAKGINGSVKVGEVDGAVRLSGINGRVELAKSSGYTEASGINGGVSLGVSQLVEQGLTVKGINGGVEIRLPEGLNADVNVRGLNGSVSLNVPNVSEQEKTRSSLRARIGTGGAPISVSGINGGVRFQSAATAR